MKTQIRKCVGVVALLLASAGAALGQAPPVPPAVPPVELPGYSVSLFVGYSVLQNAQNNNGLFSSVAVPLYTKNDVWSWTVSARADNFLLSSPSVVVIMGGPEGRFQFSKATLFNGAVFQPFGNFMLGAARSSCVSTKTCAVGQDQTSHVAYKVGGGLDMVLTQNMTARLFEVDYIRSTIFPGGGLTVNNFTQVSAAIGFHF